ncbi:hypothetical protein RclHR1_39010001, partial [Rhizophagus clarus]
MFSRLVRHLPNRPDIIKVKFSGRQFFRERIANLDPKLKARYPDQEDANLFSLLDHYNESQMPDNIGDPEWFDNFIIYMRDLPAVSSECGDTNDCLYQCLKMAYSSYSNMPQNRKHPSFECKRPKKPITYQKNKVKDTVFLYNGKDIKSITVQQFQKLKFNKNYSFVLVKCQESLEKTYIRINAERDAFLLETKKLGLPIDISLLDWNIKKTALWLFEKLSVGIPVNEPLDALEAQWISKAIMEGIIWAQNNWKGYGRSYDDASLYPSIQQSALNFPISKGKFQILKDFTNHRGYSHFGIFRASIERKDTPLFRYNYHNVYTHIDLTCAKALGLQVTLIQDGISNALIYEKETQIRDDKVLDSIVPIGEEQWRFQFMNPGNPFKGEYPRIAPFLLAHGRKFISEMVQPYVDKV